MELDEKIKDCYGKSCDGCGANCEWKTAGKNYLTEQKDDIYTKNYRYSDITLRDDFGVAAFDEFDSVCKAIDGEYTAETEQETAANIRREVANEIIRKISFFYIEHPTEFDCLVKKIFLKQNQVAVAEEVGVTRQAISKAIIKEKQITLNNRLQSVKKERDFFSTLTPLQLRVYQLLFVDGVSIRSAAQITGKSKSKIQRMGQFLRSNLNKNGTVENENSKYFEKSVKKVVSRAETAYLRTHPSGYIPDLF